MKKFLYIFAVFFIISCTSNTIYEKPKNLIPKDSMINLLTDMYIASSAKNYKNLNLQKRVNYTSLVYEKYNIDSTRFLESNIYYTSVIEEYTEMLDEVEKKLKIQQKIYTDSLNVKDSIRQIERKKTIEENNKRKKELKELKNSNSKKGKETEEEFLKNQKNKLE